MYRVNHSGRTSVMPFTFFLFLCRAILLRWRSFHYCGPFMRIRTHTRSLAAPLICMRAHTTFVDVSAAAAAVAGTMNTSEVVQWPQRESCTIDEHMFPDNDTIQDKRMHSATLAHINTLESTICFGQSHAHTHTERRRGNTKNGNDCKTDSFALYVWRCCFVCALPMTDDD